MKNTDQPSRRSFLKQASMLSAAALALPAIGQAFPSAADQTDSESHTILFQGDSITDGNRTRDMDWNHVMGHGYAYLASSRLWFEYPEKHFHFFNRGISGNKVPDLAQRWQTDTLAIKPDILSILVGINDTTSEVYGNTNFTAQRYEDDYGQLLQQTKTALPDIKLVLCEPFILPVGKVKDKWDEYQKALSGRQQAVKRLAEHSGAIFVPLQQSFNDALKRAPADYWIWDGIHPMPAGHELMARQWIKTVHQEIKYIK